MVCTVTTEEGMEGIPGEAHSGVVAHRLHGGEGEEGHGARRHARGESGEGTANRVHEETIEGMVIHGSYREGYDDGVVFGVDVHIEEPANVHKPVDEVLPGVHNHHGDGKLNYDSRKEFVKRKELIAIFHLLDRLQI